MDTRQVLMPVESFRDAVHFTIDELRPLVVEEMKGGFVPYGDVVVLDGKWFDHGRAMFRQVLVKYKPCE
jgi:hypothetical protein